jgi:CRP-like cAMP-binding protein
MNFIPKPVLTVDIVDFSLMANPNQMMAIKELIGMLNQAIPSEHNRPEMRIWSPAGDGGALTFWEDIQVAVDTALALMNFVNQRNQSLEDDSRHFQIRIGLHCGTVTKQIDFDDRENVWGEGINTSARVNGLARPGQILASEEFCTKAGLLVRGSPEVVYIGKGWAKHHKLIHLYNLYMDGAGLPPSELDVWYGPFHQPLRMAIDMYKTMLREEQEDPSGPAFRVAVLAKRLMDLDPTNQEARQAITALSQAYMPKVSGARHLYDPFLSPLSPNTLRYFFRKAVFSQYQKGGVIVEEGRRADSMMMVVSGEIRPTMQGKPMYARTEATGEEPRELIFREGAIIGEMGLFSPGGTRSATLTATRETIVLSLKYVDLSLPADTDVKEGTAPADVLAVMDIRRQVWEYYCARVMENQLNLHPLFKRLSATEKVELAYQGEFLPKDAGRAVQLAPEDAWRYWTLVVAGTLSVTRTDGTRATYRMSDCLGPLRLLVNESPFATITAAPGTQVIRFPWSVIKAIAAESQDFREDAQVAAQQELARRGT